MAEQDVNLFDTAKWASTKQSRAVIRPIDAGNSAYCAVCDELIKFRAKVKADQVICNVYIDGRWDHVEHYHPDCYDEVKRPYGDPDG